MLLPSPNFCLQCQCACGRLHIFAVVVLLRLIQHLKCYLIWLSMLLQQGLVVTDGVDVVVAVVVSVAAWDDAPVEMAIIVGFEVC